MDQQELQSQGTDEIQMDEIEKKAYRVDSLKFPWMTMEHGMDHTKYTTLERHQ